MPVSVLTGGAGGIALATARLLVDRGPILLADLSADALATAAESLRSEGATVEVAVADVSNAQDVAALAARAADLGELGALVHTAGLAPPTQQTPGAVFVVNAGGTARVLSAFLESATAATVAVCIASVAGHREFTREWDHELRDPLAEGVFDRLVAGEAVRDDVLRSYSLSKRSVLLQVRDGAEDWGARGARLVSVSPGLVVDTTIGAGAAGIHAGAYAQQSALKRPGYAADVAGVIAFLTSPAAGYITGADLLVDGGVVAHTLDHATPEARDRWNSATYD